VRAVRRGLARPMRSTSRRRRYTDQHRVSHGERVFAKVYKIHNAPMYLLRKCVKKPVRRTPSSWESNTKLASYQRDDFVYGKERLLLPLRRQRSSGRSSCSRETGLGMGQQYETAAGVPATRI